MAQIVGGWRRARRRRLVASRDGRNNAAEMGYQRAVLRDVALPLNGLFAARADAIFDSHGLACLGYGFAASFDALAHAPVVYQTAWPKAHYPAESTAAVLSSDMGHYFD